MFLRTLTANRCLSHDIVSQSLVEKVVAALKTIGKHVHF